jgi:hypothetical protein
VDRELIEYGEQAIRFLCAGGDPHELSMAYMNTAVLMEGVADPERENYDVDQKVPDYRRKAAQLSEMDALLAFVSVPSFFFVAEIGTDTTLTLLGKALNYAVKTGDNYIIGSALDILAFHTLWKAVASENPEEKVNLINAALRHAESAQQCFSKLAYVSAGFGVLWAESPYAEYYVQLADCETDFESRRVLLHKGIEAGRERLKKAEDSGYPHILLMSHHTLSKAIFRLAETEKNHDSARQLLEDALYHEKEAWRLGQALWPDNYYDQGLYLSVIAYIKSKLADLLAGSDAEYKML